jgi:hypothetical protein
MPILDPISYVGNFPFLTQAHVDITSRIGISLANHEQVTIWILECQR